MTVVVQPGAPGAAALAAALDAVPPGAAHVVVRPPGAAADPALEARLLAALDDPEVDAAVAVTPVPGTLKWLDEDGREAVFTLAPGRVASAGAVAAHAGSLREAVDAARADGVDCPDAAAAVERAGGRVAAIPAVL